MSVGVVGTTAVRLTVTADGQEVAIVGRLDVHTVADVRLALHEAIDGGAGDLLLHLVDAEVYDATGLGVIVGVHHRARPAPAWTTPRPAPTMPALWCRSPPRKPPDRADPGYVHCNECHRARRSPGPHA